MREPFGKIMDEMIRGPAVARSNKPARHEFRVGINRRPSPRITPAFFLLFFRGVLFLRTDERPNFITLNATAREVAKDAILIRGARRAHVHEKLAHGLLCEAC